MLQLLAKYGKVAFMDDEEVCNEMRRHHDYKNTMDKVTRMQKNGGFEKKLLKEKNLPIILLQYHPRIQQSLNVKAQLNELKLPLVLYRS